MFHYVYRITHTKLIKHYYGCRTSEINPKLDLGIRYFSSSSDQKFINDQRNHPYNYRYKIIKIYNNRKTALLAEIKFHIKFNVGKNK